MKYNYKNKNCIVTGASGFIGQVLTEKLLKEGANVYVIDNFSYGAKKENVDRRAKIITGDVRDYKNFRKLPKIKYEYLFHFAGPSSIILFNKNPLECFDITINGFLNAARFSIENNIRLIYPSTGSIYSGTIPPQAENTKLSIDSLNAYARAKLSLELIHKSLNKLNALGLRIFAGYGPQEKHKGEFASVVYLFCKDMKNGKRPIVFGDGTQKRDFIYIDDLIEAILVLSQNAKEGIINVGSGKSKSFNDIIRIINVNIKKQVKAKYVEKPNIYLEQTIAYNNILGKYTKISLNIEKGIDKVIKSI